jgi:hypothetical protein
MRRTRWRQTLKVIDFAIERKWFRLREKKAVRHRKQLQPGGSVLIGVGFYVNQVDLTIADRALCNELLTASAGVPTEQLRHLYDLIGRLMQDEVHLLQLNDDGGGGTGLREVG